MVSRMSVRLMREDLSKGSSQIDSSGELTTVVSYKAGFKSAPPVFEIPLTP